MYEPPDAARPLAPRPSPAPSTTAATSGPPDAPARPARALSPLLSRAMGALGDWPFPAAWSLRGWERPVAWTVALLILLVLLAPAGPSESDLLAAASAARAAWRYDRALAFYTRAAALDPDDPRPHCLAGQVLALQQLYTQAAAAYIRCQALGGDGPDTWLALGDVVQAQGDAAGAERAWLRSAAAGGLTARRRLAALYESGGRFDLAAAQWRALPATDGQAQVHLGLIALSQGDYANARADLIHARELPGFYGQDALDQGFVQLAAIGPEDGIGLSQLGFTFLQANLPTFARLPLERAVALAPNSGPAHAYLGWVEWLAGETAASKAQEAIALRLNPTEPFTLFVGAEQAMAVGRWRAARAYLALAIQSDGANPTLWAEQGRAAIGQLDYLHAELSYEIAARLGNDPVYTEALLGFYVNLRLGLDNGRAMLAADEALVRWPTQAPVFELAAQIYSLLDQPTPAQLAYQQANQLDPSDPQPYLALAHIALNDRDYVTAALDLRTVLALRPDGPLAGQARDLLAPLASADL